MNDESHSIRTYLKYKQQQGNTKLIRDTPLIMILEERKYEVFKAYENSDISF